MKYKVLGELVLATRKGMEALSKRIEAHKIRMDELEERIDNLELALGTTFLESMKFCAVCKAEVEGYYLCDDCFDEEVEIRISSVDRGNDDIPY